jgi:hypothetical protein
MKSLREIMGRQVSGPKCQVSGDAVSMELEEVVSDIASGLSALDAAGGRFREFQAGVGPFSEPQLVKHISIYLNALAKYGGSVQKKRCPDLLIPNEWAIEIKITRPFGDNGKEAENWSVNLLHPYRGNTSSIGDCYKPLGLTTPERKAVLVIGYEHAPAKIDLTPLVKSFESIANYVGGIKLGPRVEKCCEGQFICSSDG